MSNETLWSEQKLPFIRVPIPDATRTVLHAVPFSANPEPPRCLIKVYKPTNVYDSDMDKYEYVYCGWERD